MIFNILGAGMLAAGLIVGGAVYLVMYVLTGDERLATALALLWGMLTVTGADLWYRWNHNPDWTWMRFFGPRCGGMVFFVPLWVFPLAGVGRSVAEYHGLVAPSAHSFARPDRSQTAAAPSGSPPANGLTHRWWQKPRYPRPPASA